MNLKKIKHTQILTDARYTVDYTKADVFPTKVPVEKLRLVWNDDTVQYTDDQLYIIRDWMYAIAAIIIHIGEQEESNNQRTIQLTIDQNEESNFICAGEHR